MVRSARRGSRGVLEGSEHPEAGQPRRICLNPKEILEILLYCKSKETTGLGFRVYVVSRNGLQ